LRCLLHGFCHNLHGARNQRVSWNVNKLCARYYCFITRVGR
jgi:hypothetical protein